VTSQTHRVKRQIFEVSVADQGEARRVQSLLGRIQARKLSALLERCCTELGPPDRIVQISSLQIDLGLIRADRLEQELSAKLVPALRAALGHELSARLDQEVHAASGSGSSAKRGPALDPMPGRKLPAQRGSDPDAPDRDDHLDLVTTFVGTGVLPWWADSSQPRLIEQALRALLRRELHPLRSFLRTLAREPLSLQRLAYACSDETLARLLDVLRGSGLPPSEPSTSVVLPALSFLLRSGADIPGTPLTGFRAYAWAGVLQAACQEVDLTHPNFWQEALARIAILAGVPLGTLTAALRVQSKEDPNKDDASTRAEESEDAEATASRTSGLRPSREPTLKERRSEPRTTPRVTQSDPEEVYVENAGLVLLWPFLEHFFLRLGLLEEGRFISSRAQHRAVVLLQHVASGARSFEEYQLPLAKVLCGMTLNQVFDPDVPITDLEAEECLRMLAAAVAHAERLGELSPEELRRAFLLRKGVLSARDGGWLLRVEQAPYDAVLEHLPWTLSWVRLPWSEAPLAIEW
jgi:hypothetical protein